MTVPDVASTNPITGGLQSWLHPLIGPAGPEKADMTGKVAVITGGAKGIGYEVSTREAPSIQPERRADR